MPLPALGDTLAGKYRIDRVIGEGGMGIVFAAFHLRLQQNVAIKMLRPDVLGNRTVTGRFEREARAAAKLQGPNVAKVLDVDTIDGHPYLVMEYLEGHDLAAEVAERRKLPIPVAVGYMIEACVPIAQAHSQGIVHRDLKPSNLFLAMVDGKPVLKLLDFGISKFVAEGSKLTAGAEALGTPEYMSPEQIRRTATADHRSDIWSLGVILYELLTGTVPFEGPPSAVIAAVMTETIVPPRVIRREIPDLLDAVIMRALDKDPSKRFQSVSELATALAPFTNETSVTKTTLESLPPPAALAELLEGEEPAPSRRTVRSWESVPPPSMRGKRRSSAWLLLLTVCTAGSVGVFAYKRAKLGARPAATERVTTVVVAPNAEPSAQGTQNTASAVANDSANSAMPKPPEHAHSGAAHGAGHKPPAGHATSEATQATPPTATATSTNMFDQRF